MFWQHLRKVLLTGAFTVAAAVPARAEDCCAPAAPCAPATRTVCCTEWVPEQYQCTRTVYKTECRTENYTAYKTECVPEARTRTYTVCKMVPEVRTEMRTVCVKVPVVEEKTIMQTHVTCKPVTKMVTKCVDRGHWECREVPCGPSFMDRVKNRCKKKDCCDPCASCCEPCPVRTKTVKCWVPCMVTETVPVCTMERVCESRPCVLKVHSCKIETRQEAVQVTCCKMVQEQKTETCTVMVSKCVPYQATRVVKVCVPTTETVTMTRMVARTVTKQVPCEVTCCSSPCCDSCSSKKCRSGLLSGLSFRHKHSSCCD